MLLYVLTMVGGSNGSQRLREPLNMTLLCLGMALLQAFTFWVRFQTWRQRPALVSNELWANSPFTSVCITIFLVWGTLNASEQLAALYLQDSQGFSTLTSSLYFLPAPAAGLIINVIVAMVLPYLSHFTLFQPLAV